MGDALKEWFKNLRERLRINSCVNLIWLINFLPTLAGFPLLSKRIGVLFWVIHTILLFYVYITGTVVYQMYHAEGFIDSINSFFNISVFVLIFNTSWWLLYKRSDLHSLLKLIKMSDALIIESKTFLHVYQKLLKRIKIIIIMCYMFHFINDVMIFIPSRTLGMDGFSIVSCVGIQPLDKSPHRQICMGILAAQELTAIVAVGSYDVTLLFLFSYTTAIFQILCEDMTELSEITKNCNDGLPNAGVIEDRLKNLAIRHTLALKTVKRLQDIYSTAIGIGFGLDAISMCLFFVLPLDVCLNFAPLIYHSLFVFFLYCYQGQRLTTASEQFEMAVYDCGWESMRVKEQKYVLLMLKLAQRPVIVVAAGVIPIKIHTFANTMQSIYKNYLLKIKNRLQEDKFDNLVWLVNIVPSMAGFSIRKDTISAPFWCVHLPLLVYVYGVGSFVYQWKYAQGAGEVVKSYVNVTIFVLTANNSWWFLMKRPFLKSLLKNIQYSDELAGQTTALRAKHKNMLKQIKWIILIFYGFNMVNAVFVYLPHRIDTSNNYAMAPCVGLEPLDSSPNREICLLILGLQEFSIMTVVLNYQALLLCVIAHTADMYQMLAYEMFSLNDIDDLTENEARARDRLPRLIERHSLTMEVTDSLKSLYSAPLGVNFGSNAVCISLFFYSTLEEWLSFMPILVYCFLVFFLYCFLCQRLINASETFERATYCCGWENFNLKEQKMVYVMLRQAQKPVEILAAGIIPVNIYTFATTLQAMFKFVTVVKF